MPVFSIIIVNYNTVPCLLNCIDSIMEHCDPQQVELIIIDNASRQSLAPLEKYKSDTTRLYCMPQNLGFAAACNKAVSKSTGEYLLFLNPDCILLNNALGLFLDFYEKSKSRDIAVMGGQLLTESGLPAHSGATFPGVSTLVLGKLRHLLGLANVRQGKIEYVTGANLFMPRRIFESLGGFDEQFFMYFEETDLQKRAADAGYRIALVPSVKMVHIGQASFSDKKLLYHYYFASQKKYLKKHSSRLAYMFYCLVWPLLNYKYAGK